MKLVGFLKFFVAKTVHFSNIDSPYLDNNNDEEAEEQRERRTARATDGVPHFLFSFHSYFCGTFWPVCEERESHNDDKSDDGNHIPPSYILEVSLHSKSYDIYTIDRRIVIERG